MMMSKPSIYDAPKSELIVTESSNKLVDLIAQSRLFLTDKFSTTTDCIASGRDKVLLTPNYRRLSSITAQFNQIIDKNEQFSPNIFYIAVAGLGGSILARNSNFLFRLSLPPTIALATSYQLLPQSTNNVFSKIGSLEQSNFPELHQQRLELRNSINSSLQDTKNNFKDLTDGFNSTVNKGAHQIQELTGFRLGN
ncbi:hypothetical protein E3Q10_03342 [Wallemia mellicola]|uniref:MICOS complex subunit n=1 Tax=Wallemia mellicola TaxID=1708541 RepID=A0A4T0N028_9BASI|nr:hypothetical protein E3Q19_03121 [Wallemia mellicola]TIC28154.1 hypothetical protein E3Q10_03342 [Wallemia mellicola]